MSVTIHDSKNLRERMPIEHLIYFQCKMSEELREEQRDINNLFDELLFTEDRISQAGFDEGFATGRAEGNSEGYKLGYAQGTQVGQELGAIYGALVAWQQTAHSAKVSRKIEQLIGAVQRFPRTNAADEDIIGGLKAIQTSYRSVCIMLGVSQEKKHSEEILLRMSVAQIRHRLDSILTYMAGHWDFVNCHMVNYLTDNHWQQLVPEALRAEVPTSERAVDCINGIFLRDAHPEELSSNFPAFSNFFDESEKCRLANFPEILTTLSHMHNLLEKEGGGTRISIKEFMNQKKRHEVEITAELLDDVIKWYLKRNPDQELFLVDAGDGKGYLSSRLALQYEYKVLGIDFKASNSENALTRSKKLQRAWVALNGRAQMEVQGMAPPRRGCKQKAARFTAPDETRQTDGFYKTTSMFVTSELDIVSILKEHFPIDASAQPTFCLSGLHTCGNLAATCLRVFHSQSQCRVLCNIGCCYHMLKEQYSDNEFVGSKVVMDLQTEFGFPMSDYLKQKRLKIGRNARMLAAQSIDRTISNKELPNISLFYRALLESVICSQDPALQNMVQVGKLKKFSNFKEYFELVEKKANLGFATLSADTIEQLETQHSDDKHYLDLFYLIRMSFASVLESLILLDRLLYLKELNYKHSYLISLFDAIISPRHYAFIVWKD